MSLVAGIVSGATQLGNSIIQAGQSKKNIKRTLAANKELAKYQHAMNLESWQMQNAYNTPAMQMQRFQEAGLNPNLIYGQGNAGNASSIQAYPDVKADYSGQLPIASLPTDVISTYQDVKLRAAQINNVAANTAATEARTITEGYRAIAEMLRPDVMRSGIAKNEASIGKLLEDTKLTGLKQSSEVERATNLRLANELKRSLLPLLKKGQELRNQGLDLSNKKTAQDVIYKEFENQLRKFGITSSDHPLIRSMIRFWESGSLQNWWNSPTRGKVDADRDRY